MTKADIRAEVRTRLNDQTTNFYSDADIDEAIDEAYEDMADASEFYERFSNFTATTLRSYFDLSEVLPDTFLSPRQMFNPTANVWLDPANWRFLDQQRRQWELATGIPRHMMLFGNWWLGIYPKSTADQDLRFYYTAIPPAMGDSDEPGFDVEFHEGLTWGALYNLYVDQRETAKALRCFQHYTEYETALSDFVKGRQSLDRKSGLK